ncbi:hypothetical protein FNF31_06339 [Cafeteria roenbergensis]|uniref:Uncharacterized protein n=1 Tax=Cafeteria roenbergensis TaxID=33653 RepID=A0A5A8CMG9_CAFRO|nr:hypothetical protein FNF31_06339 [Cafeteria roenbergensis]KAA0158001.1 hypothetical protein FNF28_06424 [Cafeteria roenbergensis]
MGCCCSSGSHWDASRIADGSLAGKRVLITGGSSGLGLEVAKLFVSKGATVLITSRSQQRLDAAARSIRAHARSGAEVETKPLDLSSMADVRDFASWYRREHSDKPLSVLVNNAGIMAVPSRRVTEDGFELQMATNYLGHFLLTAGLLPQLLATRGSRVVNLSSFLHASCQGKDSTGVLHFEEADPFHANGASGGPSHGEYSRWEQYHRTKMMAILFTREMQRRLEKAGRSGPDGLTCVSAHPGFSSTGLLGSTGMSAPVACIANTCVAQSASMGALPILYAAAEPSVCGGEYIGPLGANNRSGYPGPNKADARASDERSMEKLWEVSVTATGADYSAIGDEAISPEAPPAAAAGARPS